MTGYAVSRYEQFETYPETIGQELRPGVCYHRQTYLRRIIVYKSDGDGGAREEQARKIEAEVVGWYQERRVGESTVRGGSARPG